MKIQGPKAFQATARAAAGASKQNIDATSEMSPEDKEKAKRAVDQTTLIAAGSEVPNTFVYWMGVGAIGLIALFIVLGGLYLSSTGQETPNFLQTTLATAIGALAGMVIPSPKSGL